MRSALSLTLPLVLVYLLYEEDRICSSTRVQG